MSWSKLVDMEMDDESKLDTILPLPAPRPDYPCGLCISLTEKEIEKLGLDLDCDVGDMIDIRAFAVVTCVNKSEGPNGPCGRVELQIQKMAVENEMTEEQDEPEMKTAPPAGRDITPSPTVGRDRPPSRRGALYARGANWDQDLA